jgi:hypothetical protein
MNLYFEHLPKKPFFISPKLSRKLPFILSRFCEDYRSNQATPRFPVTLLSFINHMYACVTSSGVATWAVGNPSVLVHPLSRSWVHISSQISNSASRTNHTSHELALVPVPNFLSSLPDLPHNRQQLSSSYLASGYCPRHQC